MHVLNPPKGKAQRRQYLLAVDLGRCKWHQSRTPDDVSAFSLFPEEGRHGGVPVRTLGPKGGGFGGGLTSIGERKECQQGRWTPKGSGL